MKIFRTIITAIIIWFPPTSSFAQGAWSQIATLPSGSSVVDVAVDKNNVIYALTYFASEIYYSGNNGVSWSKLPGTYLFDNVQDIEVDTNTNTLYVCTLNKGLFWTTNLGVTWHDEPFYTNPVSGQHAYIGAVVRKPGTGIIGCIEPGLFNNSTMYRSVNAGNTWSSSTVSIPSVNDFKYLANGHLLAGTYNGVFRSVDDGLTWSASSSGMNGRRVTDLLVHPNNGKIYAATSFNNNTGDTTNCGVFESNDGGLTWSHVSLGMHDRRITSICCDSLTGALYATYYGGVYVSYNLGQSWSAFVSAQLEGDFLSCVANQAGVFVGGQKVGVQFLNPVSLNTTEVNNGITLTTTSRMVRSADGSIFVLDEANTGVYYYDQNSWTRRNSGLPSTSGQCLVEDSNGVLFVSYINDSTILYRSVDRGLNWTPVQSLVLPPNIYWGRATVLKADNAGNTYAVVEYSSQATFVPPQVYRTSDSGATWSLLYTLDANNYIALNDIDVGPDGTIYLTLTDFSVNTAFLKSTDNGVTFNLQPVNINPVQRDADIQIAPDNSKYIVQDNKLYRQDQFGMWAQTAANPWPYNSYPTTKLYIDGNSNLYVTSLHHSIYTSADSGTTWSMISGTVPQYTPPFTAPLLIQLYDFHFDQQGYVYALATDYFSGNLPGVYRFDPAGNPSNIDDLPITNENMTISAYPNPTNNWCTIEYSLRETALVTLEIFSGSGEVIFRVSADGRLGKNVTQISLSNYPSGLYLVRVSAGKEVKTLKLLRD